MCSLRHPQLLFVWFGQIICPMSFSEDIVNNMNIRRKISGAVDGPGKSVIADWSEKTNDRRSSRRRDKMTHVWCNSSLVINQSIVHSSSMIVSTNFTDSFLGSQRTTRNLITPLDIVASSSSSFGNGNPRLTFERQH